MSRESFHFLVGDVNNKGIEPWLITRMHCYKAHGTKNQYYYIQAFIIIFLLFSHYNVSNVYVLVMQVE